MPSLNALHAAYLASLDNCIKLVRTAADDPEHSSDDLRDHLRHCARLLAQLREHTDEQHRLLVRSHRRGAAIALMWCFVVGVMAYHMLSD